MATSLKLFCMVVVCDVNCKCFELVADKKMKFDLLCSTPSMWPSLWQSCIL